MTCVSVVESPEAEAAVSGPVLRWMGIAHRYLALALCSDYLSSGRGHRQSRRVLHDRQQRKKELERPMAAGKSLRPLAREGGPSDEQGSAERAYLRDLARIPRLTSREEYGLAKRMKAGDSAARIALIEANLGLVVMLARRYRYPGVPLLDLVAEGNIGLMAATSGFNPEMGYRFATYAKWSVRQALQQALPGLIGVVRLPARKAGQAARAATADESAHDSGSEFETTSASTEHRSIDNPTTLRADSLPAEFSAFAMDSHNPIDLLTIPEDQEPPHAAQAVQRRACLRRALDTLSRREKIVVSERFALFGQAVPTLDELSRRLGVSIERVRQIEAAAVQKLGLVLRNAGESMDTLW